MEENTEKTEDIEQVSGETKPSSGNTISNEQLHLGDTAHLSIDGMGIVLFSAEVMKSVIQGSNF